MLRMMSDIVPALIACADGQLKNFSLRWFDDVALTVIMATKGYPGDYGKGFVIEGLDDAAKVEGVEIFHAGTKADGRQDPRQWRARAERLRDRQDRHRSAASAPMQAVDRIKWPEGFCRRDIGWQAVAREKGVLDSVIPDDAPCASIRNLEVVEFPSAPSLDSGFGAARRPGMTARVRANPRPRRSPWCRARGTP